MISFPSYGLVREARAGEGPSWLLTKLGIAVPLPPRVMGFSGSSTSHFSLFYPFPFLSVCALGPLTHPKLLLFYLTPLIGLSP